MNECNSNFITAMRRFNSSIPGRPCIVLHAWFLPSPPTLVWVTASIFCYIDPNLGLRPSFWGGPSYWASEFSRSSEIAKENYMLRIVVSVNDEERIAMAIKCRVYYSRRNTLKRLQRFNHTWLLVKWVKCQYHNKKDKNTQGLNLILYYVLL